MRTRPRRGCGAGDLEGPLELVGGYEAFADEELADADGGDAALGHDGVDVFDDAREARVAHFDPFDLEAEEMLGFGGDRGSLGAVGGKERFAGFIFEADKRQERQAPRDLEGDLGDEFGGNDVRGDEDIVLDAALLAEGAHDFHGRGEAFADDDAAEARAGGEAGGAVALALNALGFGEGFGGNDALVEEKLPDPYRHLSLHAIQYVQRTIENVQRIRGRVKERRRKEGGKRRPAAGRREGRAGKPQKARSAGLTAMPDEGRLTGMVSLTRDATSAKSHATRGMGDRFEDTRAVRTTGRAGNRAHSGREHLPLPFALQHACASVPA